MQGSVLLAPEYIMMSETVHVLKEGDKTRI